MPDLTNTLVDAAGRPITGSLITIELIGVWSADGRHETQPAAVWSGTTNGSGVWTASLPAQSAYEGDTYYLVREPSVSHTCTVADSPGTQQLRDRLMTPVPAADSVGIALDDLTDVSTSGASPGEVLGLVGALWQPVAQSGGGGGGSVDSVTAADATISITGTATDPVVGVGAIPESKVTNLTTDLAGKAATVHTHTESQVTNLVADLAAKAASVHTHAESDVTSLVSDLAAKAADSAVVHNTGAESVSGVKTFTSAPVVPVPGAAGNPVRNDDTRLSDSRAPSGSASGSLSGTYPNPGIAAGSIGGTEIAAAIKDPAAGTAGLRTLGTGAAQAAPGNDSRLSDARTPTGAAGGDLVGTYPNPTIKTALNDPVAATPGLRTLGTGAQQATAGNDARLSDARTPTAHAHPESDVTGLVTDLSTLTTAVSGKAATVHTHAESDTTNLVTDLASKAVKLTPTGVKTTAYTAVSGDLVRVDATSGAVPITLPAAAAGLAVAVKKTDSSTNTVTFTANGADTIDGAATGTLRLPNETRTLLGIAGGWTVASGLNTLTSLDARYPADSAVVHNTGNETVAGVKTFSSEPSMPSLKVTGVSGLTTGRFVGVTTVGAPISGTFAVGDYVLDQNGNMYICTAAGTVGTWVNPRDLADYLAVGQETIRRDVFSPSATTVTGVLNLTFFSARKSETTTQVKTISGTTAAGATPTVCLIGLYSVDVSGNGTLVASIANDTGLFSAAQTVYTRSWLSSYAMASGGRYALGVLVVTAATAPTLIGAVAAASAVGTEWAASSPRLCGRLTGQSTLPSSFTDAGLSNATVTRHYGVILP